ncbi:MAG: DUF2975 domain-containing protein [Propionibacteriaceae bacterium]|jgi:hypothetical protein|nr:DUF2975 domain-containing protein [Propionibacteriaceae bacterium]
MNKFSLNVLIGISIVVWVGVAVLAVIAVPEMTRSVGVEFTQLVGWVWPLRVGMYISVAVLFVNLASVLQVLFAIRAGHVFEAHTREIVTRFQWGMAAQAVAASITCAPLFVTAADVDDAPGIILFGFAFTLSPFILFFVADVIKQVLAQRPQPATVVE